jgi:hypothetical protein
LRAASGEGAMSYMNEVFYQYAVKIVSSALFYLTAVLIGPAREILSIITKKYIRGKPVHEFISEISAQAPEFHSRDAANLYNAEVLATPLFPKHLMYWLSRIHLAFPFVLLGVFLLPVVLLGATGFVVGIFAMILFGVSQYYFLFEGGLVRPPKVWAANSGYDMLVWTRDDSIFVGIPFSCLLEFKASAGATFEAVNTKMYRKILAKGVSLQGEKSNEFAIILIPRIYDGFFEVNFVETVTKELNEFISKRPPPGEQKPTA